MLKRKVSWLLSFVLVMTLALSFSVESRASQPLTDWQVDLSVNKSQSSLIYSVSNCGEVEASTNEYYDNSGTLFSHDDYYFYYFDHLGSVLTSSRNVYAYQIRFFCTDTSYSGSQVIHQSYAIGTWDEFMSGAVPSVLSTAKNDSCSFWLVTDYSEVSYYLGLLSYCHSSYASAVYSSGHSWNQVYPASYSLSSNVTMYIRSYTQSQYLSAIAGNTAETNKKLDVINGSISNTNTKLNILNDNVIEQTQKQTDTLTSGYDNSGMESTNKQLADSLNSFDQTESQVTDQSVEYIDAVTFFDPTSHLQLMTSVTYVSTFLQSLFVSLGDWSVLVMIALSLAFALMLVGWFKYRK